MLIKKKHVMPLKKGVTQESINRFEIGKKKANASQIYIMYYDWH